MTQAIGTLNQFSPDTIAQSAKVNANFAEVKTKFNTHAAAITGEHGVAGTAFADTDSVQTFENKTLTSPTITSPTITLGLLSAFKLNSADKDASYTILDDDNLSVIFCSSANNITLTLPTVADNTNRVLVFIKNSAADTGTVTIDGEDAETINGAASYSMAQRYDAVALISNGTYWSIVWEYAG